MPYIIASIVSIVFSGACIGLCPGNGTMGGFISVCLCACLDTLPSGALAQSLANIQLVEMRIEMRIPTQTPLSASSPTPWNFVRTLFSDVSANLLLYANRQMTHICIL